MERVKIVKEYFDLRNLLNKSNKLPDEKTKFRFEIMRIELSEYRFYAIVEGRFEEYKVVLCFRDRSRLWAGAGFTPFQNLEDYCASELNKKEFEMCLDLRSFFLTEVQMTMLSQRLKATFDELLI